SVELAPPMELASPVEPTSPVELAPPTELPSAVELAPPTELPALVELLSSEPVVAVALAPPALVTLVGPPPVVAPFAPSPPPPPSSSVEQETTAASAERVTRQAGKSTRVRAGSKLRREKAMTQLSYSPRQWAARTNAAGNLQPVGNSSWRRGPGLANIGSPVTDRSQFSRF